MSKNNIISSLFIGLANTVFIDWNIICEISSRHKFQYLTQTATAKNDTPRPDQGSTKRHIGNLYYLKNERNFIKNTSRQFKIRRTT